MYAVSELRKKKHSKPSNAGNTCGHSDKKNWLLSCKISSWEMCNSTTVARYCLGLGEHANITSNATHLCAHSLSLVGLGIWIREISSELLGIAYDLLNVGLDIFGMTTKASLKSVGSHILLTTFLKSPEKSSTKRYISADRILPDFYLSFHIEIFFQSINLQSIASVGQAVSTCKHILYLTGQDIWLLNQISSDFLSSAMHKVLNSTSKPVSG